MPLMNAPERLGLLIVKVQGLLLEMKTQGHFLILALICEVFCFCSIDWHFLKT
jgi:hypothetical protein